MRLVYLFKLNVIITLVPEDKYIIFPFMSFYFVNLFLNTV